MPSLALCPAATPLHRAIPCFTPRSVWLDTTGREIVVRRPVEFDESGWPRATDEKMKVERDQVGA